MENITSAFILDAIPFRPDVPGLVKRLRIKEGSQNAQEFQRLLDEALVLARPRALYQAAYIDERGDDWVVIDGRRFTSRVLKVNLDPVGRVFPYLATCGMELQDWSNHQDDLVLHFWAEAIKESALTCAIVAMYEDLRERMHTAKTSSMNPGSLADWPMQEQRVLFNLIGDNAEKIGVQLTDSFLMIPTKSVSGICFPTEFGFESCQLCPREGCPNRRAPYDSALYEAQYCPQN